MFKVQDQIASFTTKNIIPIKSILNEDFKFISPLEFDDEPAVYGFWWTGDLSDLKNGSRDVNLAGKNSKNRTEDHDLKWETDWFQKGLDIFPLYIGKTTVLKQRVKQHFHTSIPKNDWYNLNRPKCKGVPNKRIIKHTTSCQFRAGFEHLFRNRTDRYDKVRENVVLTFLTFDKKEVANRFYLEDLLIGHYRPWFNLDSER